VIFVPLPPAERRRIVHRGGPRTQRRGRGSRSWRFRIAGREAGGPAGPRRPGRALGQAQAAIRGAASARTRRPSSVKNPRLAESRGRRLFEPVVAKHGAAALACPALTLFAALRRELADDRISPPIQPARICHCPLHRDDPPKPRMPTSRVDLVYSTTFVRGRGTDQPFNGTTGSVCAVRAPSNPQSRRGLGRIVATDLPDLDRSSEFVDTNVFAIRCFLGGFFTRSSRTRRL